MITIYVHKTQARAELDAPVTSGSVGREVQFQFSDDWAGLAKTAVFETSSGYKDFEEIPDTGVVKVPKDVMLQPGAMLFIGVEGKSSDGTIVIPTIYAEIGKIYRGANTEPNDAQIPPTLAARLQSQITALDNRVTDEETSNLEQSRVLENMPDGWSMDDQGYLYLLANGTPVIGPIGPFNTGDGSGGGSAPSFEVTLMNLLESRVITVPEKTQVVLKFNYSSVDEEGMDDGPGVGQLLVGGIVRKTFSVVQGENSLDITSYLAAGTNNISVRVTNSESSSKVLTYTVTVAAVSLTSSFDPSVPYSGTIKFPYTPVGIVEKKVRFEVDGKEIGTEIVSTSGRQVSYTIPAQTHGAHTLRVWFTCTIEGTEIKSNELYYSIICTVDGDTTPIIAVTTPPLTGVEQYSNIVKKFRVYDPAALTAPITLEVDGEVVASLTVDRTEQTWTYRPLEAGEVTQTIRCGDVAVSWTQTVTESSIHVEAETEELALHLSSYGRSNNEENPGVWENNGIAAEFAGFNFVSDGWKTDEQENTVLRVTGDARLTIPYRLFSYDFRTTGKTVEIELATRDVLSYDAEVLSCFGGGRGLKITAQQLRIASEQSTLGTRYKEDEHIRVTFVAEKKSENRLLLCYINGIMSGAVQYPEDDDFAQAEPVGITIGSNYCTTDLYNIRVYDNSLTRYQILDNWIADAQDGQERIDRYQRNNIYDAYGRVVVSQLPGDLCYLVLQADELPQFKGDKKKCSGYFVDLQHPERSFTFTDAEIDVQGTSSQYYYRKNYKIKFKGGFILYDGSTVEAYQMNEDAVPVSTFTMKADVASSEGAFNVVLSMLYNDLCPFKTPAQEADPNVRQCIEGFPMVIFWAKDNELQFLGKYNFNNDKGTEEVFGFQSGDESWETLQNGTARVGWHSADFSGDGWKTDFEARYPDKNTDITRLQALAAWLVSTDTDQATGAAITPVTYDGVEYTTDTVEYRLAKFSAELNNYFVEEAIIFYYLFTEIFLSIDQREKNAFPTYIKALDRWIVLFYDADSSCGTDNKGNLAFDYYLEDIDYTEGGDPVYNGQNSVLWKNLRETRRDEIMAMYQSLRTTGEISYDAVIGRFNDHQSKWPEAIFNEDMYTKCIEPLVLDGDGLYLPMLQGKKEQWMKWWLYNRFRYLDSKYVTGTSMTNRITIRAHQKASVFLTSYVNMYGHVYFNAAMVENRMERGTAYEFPWPASGAEDPVIGINDADLLTSLGDLSPLMVELIDVSGSPHLTELKIGDGAEGYANYSLNSITLGNNKLLRTIDCRNCPNLTMAPDVSGCTNIEEIYFEGSSITGLKLPDGGVLKKLHLPETLANLTVRNQPLLEDFSMPGYGNISTLNLENAGAVNDHMLAILEQLPVGSRVRLIGFDETFAASADIMEWLDRLDAMRGLDENGNNTDNAQVSGRLFVETAAATHAARFTEAMTKYPGLTIEWNNVRNFEVSFYNGNVLMQTVANVVAGTDVTYTGETPTKDGYEFIGWSPEPVNVQDDLVCYAVFRFVDYFALKLVERTLNVETYENARVTSVGDYVFGYGKVVNYRFPAATSIGESAFNNSDSVKSVDAPLVKTLGAGAFQSCWVNLESVNFPLLEEIGYSAFGSCGKITRHSYPNSTRVDGYAFYGNDKAEFIELGAAGSESGVRGSTFQNCSALVTLIIRAETAQKLDNINALQGTPIESGTGYIYVPAALVDSYKTMTNWSTYAAQFRAIEDYPDICGGV